jgi:hypothetical protein
MILLLSSNGSLMRLWEEYSAFLPFLKGLDLLDESPLLKGWVSAPPVCPPDETCRPESMVGTMILLGRELPSFQGGEEAS